MHSGHCNCGMCEDNKVTVVCGGNCTVCGPFTFGPQDPNTLEVWSTSNGSFVPGTVIIKVFNTSSAGAQVRGIVETPSGPVLVPTPPLPPITPGNSYAESFPAISKLTISRIAGSNVDGEFCVCVGQVTQTP